MRQVPTGKKSKQTNKDFKKETIQVAKEKKKGIKEEKAAIER